MIAIVAFTRQGCELGQLLAEQLEGSLYVPQRFSAAFQAKPYGSLSQWTEVCFREKKDIIFVSATGIAVRSIAPYVKDKLTDPAVVAVDEQGHYAIPLLSGHVGGGNKLACRVASITGGTAVISTATDLNGCFAVDAWAVENDLLLMEREYAKEISAALLEGGTVGFAAACPVEGELPPGVIEPPCDLGFCVSEDFNWVPFRRTLHLIPQNLILGLGCKRGTTKEHLEDVISAVLLEQGLDARRVAAVGTITLKQNEAGLLELCREKHWPIHFFSPEELNQAEGSFTPSAFVAQTTGVDNVCERAAACLGGDLLLTKQAREGVTVAVARLEYKVRFS